MLAPSVSRFSIASVSAATPVLELRGITKEFPGIVANDHVDFDLLPGEVHALLGENGAGKSTLMNIATGVLQPDSGTITVGGREVHGLTPREATALVRTRLASAYWSTSTPIPHLPASSAALSVPRPQPPATWKSTCAPWASCCSATVLHLVVSTKSFE